MICAWFRNMGACVRWGNKCSDYFYIKSDVSEGSLFGSLLCNIVMDKLLLLLKNSHIGCHIAGLFAGVIAYADNLTILSISVCHLQLMLDMCVNLGRAVIYYLIVINLNMVLLESLYLNL